MGLELVDGVFSATTRTHPELQGGEVTGDSGRGEGVEEVERGKFDKHFADRDGSDTVRVFLGREEKGGAKHVAGARG